MPILGKSNLRHVKQTRAKGSTYWYFNTGRKNEKGKIVFVALPDPRDPSFGARYAALLGHRNRNTGTPLMTVAKLVDMYQRSQHWRDNLSAGTQRTYSIYLTKLVNEFGPAQPEMLERQDMVAAVDELAETPGAANMLLKTTRSLYKWARSKGHLANDPCKDIDLMVVGEHQPWPDDLLQAALTCDNDRVRVAVHLLYYTAQRIGDVMNMRWSAIKDGVIEVCQQKTGTELFIPLHEKLAAELVRTPKVAMTIISGPHGKPLGITRMRTVIQEWAEKQGANIVPHGLRKNAVNALLEAGCSVPQTAAISGQSFAVVESYAKRRNQKKLGRAAVHIWQENKG